MSDVRAMIEARLQAEGVVATEWREGADGLEAVLKHRWRVVQNDDDRGLYEGDVGTVTACVVGSAKYNNERVIFSFEPDGYEGGNEVRLFDDVDAAD